MARGILYHITTNLHNVGRMNKDFLNESPDELSVDYLKNLRGRGAEESLQNLIESLETAGFTILKTPEEERDNGYVSFTLLPMDKKTLLRSKKAYFKDQFERAKKTMEKLDETQFATDSMELWNMQQALENTYGDAVWFGDHESEYVVSLQDCIRKLQPDTTYYVADNTVLMH